MGTGIIWMLQMRMTPSQVAELPYSDVVAVETFFGKYFEKLNPKK